LRSDLPAVPPILPWDGKTEVGLDWEEWERRARRNSLAISVLRDALPSHWPISEGVATREDLLREILRFIWVAVHDPDARVAAYHTLEKLGVLRDLYVALSLLDFGQVHPLLRPEQVNHRPRPSTEKIVIMAIVAATYRALTMVDVKRNDAARKTAALVKKQWRSPDRTPMTPGMVYRYWRRLRYSLEYEFLLQIIMSGGRCAPEDLTARREINLFEFDPSEASIIKEATATLDRFLRARPNCR